MILNIVVAEDDKSIMVDFDETDMIIIGRGSEDVSAAVYVDLGIYRARQFGVSRIHAIIRRHENNIFLEDQGSANGTYLNGIRLFPHQPRMMRDKDEVHLGQLALKIRIGHAATDLRPGAGRTPTPTHVPRHDDPRDQTRLLDDPDFGDDPNDNIVPTGTLS